MAVFSLEKGPVRRLKRKSERSLGKEDVDRASVPVGRALKGVGAPTEPEETVGTGRQKDPDLPVPSRETRLSPEGESLGKGPR